MLYYMLREGPGPTYLAAQTARVELSKDILGSRAIGDRVHAFVPKEVFELLIESPRQVLGRSGAVGRHRSRVQRGPSTGP